MKLSISNIAWKNEYNDEVYLFLKETGFSGLEIAPSKIFLDNPYDKINEAVLWSNELKEKYNLIISSMQSIWYNRSEKIFETKEQRDTLILYTKKAIDFAFNIGCKNLVFGCPKNRNIKSLDDYKIAIDFFRELGDYAYLKNTVLALEANPKIYNTNFINDTKSALELIKNVNSKGLKLNLDIGTIIQNNENIEELTGNVYLINHTHISEPFLELIKKRDLHIELINILKSENYNNFISIEMKQQEDINNIRKTIKYLKDITN